jgi:hypothetical protein
MKFSLNKQKEKDWDNLIKEIAKSNGWKFNGWFAYKAMKDFFYKVNFYTSGIDNSISGSLEFKPLIIDEVFWEIVDLEDNKKKPLSFRGNGAFVISSKDVFDFNQTVIRDNLKNDINILFDKINIEVDKIQSTITDLDKFKKYIEQYPSKRSEWFDTDLLIMTSIVQKSYDKAISLLEYAKKERGMCSWGFGEKDFYDLAIEYCQRHR